MRSYTSPDSPLHCSSCLLQRAWCICAEIQPIANDVSVVVVRHWKERERTSNTVRLLSLALERCEVYEWGKDREEFLSSYPVFEASESALLYPAGGEDPEVDMEALAHFAATPPRVLCVVDGSWRQVRRMVRKVPGMQSLPRLFLPPPANPPPRMREARHPWAMSTIEAVAGALALLEGEQKAAPLEALFREFVNRLQLQSSRQLK